MMLKKECRKKHLTQEERIEIYVFLEQKLSYREMWRRLWRPHSTISKEIKRNSIWCKSTRWTIYKPLKAEKQRLERRHKENHNHIILWKDFEQRELIEKWLKLKWKERWPDEILWRIKLELWRDVVSVATLYRFIREERPVLQSHLRYKQKWYKTLKKGNKRKKMYQDVPNIKEREEVTNNRWRIWDFEWDTVVSGRKYSWWLVTMADRKSRYYLLRKVINLKASTINKTINAMLTWEKVESITFDNWVEFSKIQKLKWQCFRADAYSSWQRWTNEKHNWYVRRFIPKWANIDERTAEEIQEIQDKINHKPRKILGYKTPYEVYHNINLKYIN
jgi:IS30 family transposase